MADPRLPVALEMDIMVPLNLGSCSRVRLVVAE